MDNILPIVMSAVIIFAVLAIVLIVSGRKGGDFSEDGGKKGSKQKGRSVIIREATRKLSSDPHNPAGLIPLGDLYFKEQNWEKAAPIYETMFTIAAAHREIDPFLASLRQGICALKLGKIDDAFKGLQAALKISADNVDVNRYLGEAYFKKEQYDKVIPLLKKVIILNPEVTSVYSMLGAAYYKSKHFRDSLPYLKRAVDANPEDKESLFNMADAMQESGMADKAMKIFLHMRPDPVYGAKSCLAVGMYHAKNNQNDKAVSDFEIGLKHENIPVDTQLELRYRLSQCYFALNQIGKGIAQLKQIQLVNPTYKDIVTLLSRYQELSQNSNLNIYLSAGSSDYVALCRKIVAVFYKRSVVKIQDIAVNPEYTEITAIVENAKWEDTELFRFYRTSGSVGELYVRDFHSKVRDGKVDKGVCFIAGVYTEEALRYAEGRPIDLVDKSNLTRILKQIDMSNK